MCLCADCYRWAGSYLCWTNYRWTHSLPWRFFLLAQEMTSPGHSTGEEWVIFFLTSHCRKQKIYEWFMNWKTLINKPCATWLPSFREPSVGADAVSISICAIQNKCTEWGTKTEQNKLLLFQVLVIFFLSAKATASPFQYAVSKLENVHLAICLTSLTSDIKITDKAGLKLWTITQINLLN